ncbi:hypothetical protein OG339_28660 [Streptosporangium sp. NBC_01495]|uniref:hypothetical protein n=1 Tax=Streptosporangium sp. NBC_01495 TaxID=2903899 RepID=UPI002E3156E9|nr:hypothetical protein [Streptosporangium sp. NBC_01495]
MVARFWRKIAVIAALLAVGVFFLAIQLGEANQWERYTEEGRAYRVLVNAFAVAHYGYHVDFFGLDGSDFNINSRGGVISLRISARSPYLKFTPQWNAFPVTINVKSPMSIEVPLLDRTLTVQAIDDIGSTRVGDKGASRNLLQSIRSPLLATVVVKLNIPMNERAVNLIWADRIDAIVLGGGDVGNAKPITWAGGACGAMGFDCDSVGDSRLREFQRWVATLEDEDEDALKAFELNLHELRKRASDGLVQGLVVTAKPDDLQKLIDDSRIQWLRVTDVFVDR